jgi:multiple sugar transport system permease protein
MKMPRMINSIRIYSSDFIEGRSKIYRFRLRRFSAWALRFAVLFAICFVLLYPLLYMVSVSLRPGHELTDPIVVWIPRTVTLENFRNMLDLLNYPKLLFNSAMLSFVASFLQLVSCAIAGYGFARFKFRGRGVLFALVLFTIIVPPQSVAIPLYMNFRNFDVLGILRLVGLIVGADLRINLLDTLWAIFLPAAFASGIRAGLFVYVFRQFFRSMPIELEDAAYIDGCSPVRVFRSVMVPNAGPALLVSFLFSLVWYWNDYFYVGMFLNKLRTLSLDLGNLGNILITQRTYFEDFYWVDFIAYTQAAALLYILPLLLIFVLLQRYFTESIERTGLVG